MGRWNKVLAQIRSADADASIRFTELCGLLGSLGFTERVRGSHHIFSRPDVREIINLQPRGAMAKPYQVRQVRSILMRFHLDVGDDT